MAAYDLERVARLDFDPRTRANYARYLIGRRLSADVDYLPVKLDIENVSRCNFACTMCAVSKWPHRKRAGDMSVECFRRLIDEQYGLVEIKLNGLGEALMQGDDYFTMVRYARERRIWVRMTTNASLLGTNDNAFKLLTSGVNEVDISVDGVDAETFEGIRVGSNFRMVARNCSIYNELAKLHGKPSAKMWTLVQAENVGRLEEHVLFAVDHGFEHLVFSLQLHGWADPELERLNAAKIVSVSQDRAEALVDIGRRVGVRVSFWDVSTKFSTESRDTLCPWPFERAVVTSDSRTVPCCMIGNPTKFELAPGLAFADAWKSEDYVDFRRDHLEGRLPTVCRSCYK